MKRLFILLILLLAVPAYAQQCSEDTKLARLSPAMMGSVPTSSLYCNSCPDASSGADVMCETWRTGDTTDGDCAWSVESSENTTGDVDFSDTTFDNDPALGCTNIDMTYVTSFTKTSETSGHYIIYKTFSAETALYAQFYVKFTAEAMNNTNYVQIFGVGTDAYGYNVVAIALLQDTSDSLLHFMMDTPVSVYDMGATVVSLDQWYGVRVKILDSANALEDSVQWWVDYSNNGTWTDEGTTTGFTFPATLEGAAFGAYANIRILSFIITGFRLDNDTMPDACAR